MHVDAGELVVSGQVGVIYAPGEDDSFGIRLANEVRARPEISHEHQAGSRARGAHLPVGRQQ